MLSHLFVPWVTVSGPCRMGMAVRVEATGSGPPVRLPAGRDVYLLIITIRDRVGLIFLVGWGNGLGFLFTMDLMWLDIICNIAWSWWNILGHLRVYDNCRTPVVLINE